MSGCRLRRHRWRPGVPHAVKFTQGSDGAWLLSSDTADTDSGPTPTTQVSGVDAVDGTDDGGVGELVEGGVVVVGCCLALSAGPEDSQGFGPEDTDLRAAE